MRLDLPGALTGSHETVAARWLFDPARRSPREEDEIVTAFRDGQVTLRSKRRVEGFTNAVQEIGYQGIRCGDLVIHGMDGFAGAIGVSESDGKSSPVVHAWTGRPDVDARYYAYLLRTLARVGFITSLAKGIRERSTAFDAEVFRSLRLPSPPLGEQQRIADFLDVETARIDALIDKKQQMIDLVVERLANALAWATLRGVEGRATERSRSPFFDAVPMGWIETRLSQVDCEVQTGPFGSQLHAEDYVEDGWPVINPASLVGGVITPIPKMMVSDATRNLLSRHILRHGDIVFGRRGEMGRAALVTSAEVGWLCGTGSLRLRLTGRSLLPEYLKLVLETPALRGYFTLTSVGSTMENLNSEIVLSAPVLIPSLDEQRRIIDATARLHAEAQALLIRIRRQVELLAEHRQALVSAAVTGELDLGVAA